MNDTDKLWKSYSKKKSPEIKEALILEYVHLVKYVAGRLTLTLGQYVDFDDLVGYGVFGLIDAIDKFDYDKGFKFETYASLRIRGSIIDSIRKLDWVPRSIRTQVKELERANQKLEIELGRDPTEEELAKELNVSTSEVQEMIKKTSISSLISLDEFSEQKGAQSETLGSNYYSPESELDKKEAKKVLLEALHTLTEKEQYVINLYYFDELTLKEISKILEVSESRISQVHSKAIFKLNNKLGKYKSILFNN